jgi:UDP-glucuronate 4-epimerase
VKILVTGAAGFVGSHVLKKLKELELDVYGIDNFSSYYSVDYKNLRLEYLGLTRGSDVITCDISDYGQVSEIISVIKPDYIIHLAAQAGVRLSLKDSSSYISANVAGFQNITRSSIENKVKGIVYASSSSVYGDSTPTPYKEASISLRPKSLYGVTKLSNELFAEIQSKSNNLCFRGLRYFTVYGPWGRPDMAYFRIAAAALGQGQFTLFGDGSIARDFTFIDDVVANTVKLLLDLTKREKGFNDVVNLGGGRPLTMIYLIELIAAKGNAKLELKKSLGSELDSKITIADASYLRSILGKVHFTSLETGVDQLMDWASQQEIVQNLKPWIEGTP